MCRLANSLMSKSAPCWGVIRNLDLGGDIWLYLPVHIETPGCPGALGLDKQPASPCYRPMVHLLAKDHLKTLSETDTDGVFPLDIRIITEDKSQHGLIGASCAS